MAAVEFMTVEFKSTDVSKKAIGEDGEEYGIVEGYASTWQIDEGRDQIERGAFSKSIEDYVKRGNKKVPAKYMHIPERITGGLDPSLMREDEDGLFVSMELNLLFEDGLKSYCLAKQGVLREFSIGYIVIKSHFLNGIRIITELKLIEVSLVDHPMNQGAIVTQVKFDKGNAETKTVRDVEAALKEAGFSGGEARVMIGVIKRDTKAEAKAEATKDAELKSALRDLLK